MQRLVTSQNKNQVETKDTGCFGCLQDALTGYKGSGICHMILMCKKHRKENFYAGKIKKRGLYVI